jgi:hypothetical protein
MAALALVGSFELLMTLIRSGYGPPADNTVSQPVPPLEQDVPPALTAAPTLEETVRAWHQTGHSQRAIARELNIDRRKVKRILDEAA